MTYKPTISVLFFLISAQSLLAIPVTIVGDAMEPSRIAKVVQQIKHAKELVDKSRMLVSKTNRLVEIAGDPKAVLKSMQDIESASRQLDQIFNVPTTHEIRKLVSGSTSLKRSGDLFHDRVGESFLSGKKQVPRNANLYQTFSLFEQSYDNFDDLLDRDREIQKREIERQTDLLHDLAHATTQAEVDKITASLVASQSAQDVSSQQVIRHYYEIEMQEKALKTAQKKAEMAAFEEHMEELKEAKKRVDERERLYGEQFNRRIKASTYVPYHFEII